MDAKLEQQLTGYVEAHRERLVEIIAALVQIPSENKPPLGAEQACQQHLATQLCDRAGVAPDLYELSEIPGIRDHPLYWPGNDYQNRPNLGARRKGAGGGRSLVLSGHIDTVPTGSLPWTRDPFCGTVEGNRLYGRGSNDMKAGVGIHLFLMEAVQQMGLRLAGDLMFESVVDEEFGGVNGTVAGRLRGYNADAAVITEPSFLRICSGHRGGRTAHITLKAAGGILNGGKFASGVLDQLTHFLNALPDFAAHRKETAPPHALFGASEDPVPVSITKVFTSPWGTNEPITIPETCKIEMYWQLMPGESQEAVEQEFFAWLEQMTASAPHLYPQRPEVTFPIRWLPGSTSPNPDALVEMLKSCAAKVLPAAPLVAGLEGPCDVYVFHEFGIPGVIFGPRGGNTHGADEYLEIDTAVSAAKSMLLFVAEWCGVAG